MARNQPRPQAPSELRLEPIDNHCPICEGKLWVAYHNARTVATLSGLVRLRLVVRWCVNEDCELYHERLWAIRDSAQRVSKKGNESQGS